jgi:hypothetical protein
MTDQTDQTELAAANARIAELEQRNRELITERANTGIAAASSAPAKKKATEPGINDVVMYEGAAAHVMGILEGGELELLVRGETTVRAQRGEWTLLQ